MQVRDYIAAQSSHPSDTQVPVHCEGIGTQPLPSGPHLDNRPQTDLATRDLWDLDDDQLWEVLEAVHLETARWEGAIPQTFCSGPGCRVLGAVGKLTWMTGK